jgi:hypothetical protein
MAVQTEQGDVVAMLVEKGADVQAKTRDGKTPMDLARNNATGDIMDMLKAKLPATEPTAVKPVGTPPPVQPVKPVEPSKPAIAKGQIMLVIMNFGGNRVPGQRDCLIRNTGLVPVKGELVWKTIDGNDNVLSGRLNLSLDANGQQQVKIGRPIPIITNYTATATSPHPVTPGYGSSYRPTPTVTQPNENKFGFLVEFWVNGELNNTQSQPPDARSRITAIQGN